MLQNGKSVVQLLPRHWLRMAQMLDEFVPVVGPSWDVETGLFGWLGYAVPLRGAAVQIASCWLGRVCGEAVPGGATVELGWLEAAVRGAQLLPAWGMVSGCMAGYRAQWCKPTPVSCVAYRLPRFSGHADGTVAYG